LKAERRYWTRGQRRRPIPFQDYNPEQAALLPLHVRDVLSEKYLVFLISGVVERQDLGTWEAAYSEEGQRPYHPALLLKVLLYAFAIGMRGSRKIEQRVKEDLGFRYLAGEAEPDHKTICEFLRRHGRRVNDLFTAVLEQLQAAGLGTLGVVALDSTRVKANASRDRVMSEAGLRAERARKRRQVRRWQRELAALEAVKIRAGWSPNWNEFSSDWPRFPASCRNCAKADSAGSRAATGTAASCAAGRDSCWATRRKRR
jgi:transposase